MCGICGFYGPDDLSLLKRMSAVISHRGPDAAGYYSDGKVSLGHRRLAIIDLSAKGKNPMWNEDHTICIVFNGEIYNYKELKEKLLKKHRFSSLTDTEVIVHGYEQWGDKIISMLDGDFAFALWDTKKKRLILARDRVGVKPLYYSEVGGRILFASEIKSILQEQQLSREIDYTALNHFFALRHIPGWRTIFSGVKKIPPGHYLSIEKGKMNLTKYWELEFKEEKMSIGKASALLDKALKESIESQLMSDVPLGGFIGGGIDSSTIISYMSRAQKERAKTFTIGFQHESDYFNEYNYAKLVAKHFNTEHQEIMVEPKSVKLLPEIVWHLDEPMADPSSITSYILARESSKKVTVVLSGEGGDELFGGYEQYRMMHKFNSLNKMMPTAVKKTLVDGMLRMLPQEGFFVKFRHFLMNLEKPEISYAELISVFDDAERKMLYSKSLSSMIGKINSDVDVIRAYFKNSYSLLNKMLLTDIKTALPENLLMNLDKLGMAYSMEGRVPLLGSKVVDVSSRIPTSYKIKGNNEKFILKYTMRNKVPKEIWQRKKRRFHVPTDTWWNLYLKDFTKDMLQSPDFRSKKFFDEKYIDKLLSYQNSLSYKVVLKNNMLTKLYYSRQLWNVMVFALWHKIFIEDEASSRPRLVGVLA